MTHSSPFWETKSLDEMTEVEWESLCDGCGRCCLQKLEDADTGEVYQTDVACRLLDLTTCRCRHYRERVEHVPDCLSVRPLTADKLRWLPDTCAYRRLASGKTLLPWHPLITGSGDSTQAAGIGVAGRCVSETDVSAADMQTHVVNWLRVAESE